TKNSMSKGSFFVGQPVFAQLLRMIPRWEVQKSAKKFSADHYCKVFRTYEHLTVMLYAIFNKCTSLREVTTGIMACHSKLLHLGLDYTVRRSTLSDANTAGMPMYSLTFIKSFISVTPDFCRTADPKSGGKWIKERSLWIPPP